MSQAVAEQVKPHIEQIRQRISNGEYASRIADELGISKQILSYHLKQHPEWRATLETAHETRLDSGQAELEAAVEQRDFDLARAREGQLKRLEWRAEREFPERWGQRSHVTVETVGDLGDRLRRAEDRRKGRTIDAQPVSDAQIVAQTPLAKPAE